MKKRSIFVVAACVVCCGTLRTEPVPTPGSHNIRALFEKSDVVCRGRVASVTILSQTRVAARKGFITRTDQSALLVVDRAYKGDVHSVAINFTTEDGRLSSALEPMDYALVFLTSAGPSFFGFTDRFYGELPIEPIRQDSVSTSLGIEQLERDVVRSLNEATTNKGAFDAVYILQGFDKLTGGSKYELDRRALSGDSEVALAALGVLLKTGEPRYLAAFGLRLKT